MKVAFYIWPHDSGNTCPCLSVMNGSTKAVKCHVLKRVQRGAFSCCPPPIIGGQKVPHDLAVPLASQALWAAALIALYPLPPNKAHPTSSVNRNLDVCRSFLKMAFQRPQSPLLVCRLQFCHSLFGLSPWLYWILKVRVPHFSWSGPENSDGQHVVNFVYWFIDPLLGLSPPSKSSFVPNFFLKLG